MEKVTVIAEIGSNHAGLLTLAKDLISIAAQAGADVIKLQAFNEEIWTTPEAALKRRDLMIDEGFAQECASFAGHLGLEFMCTPFYVDAVRWLDPLVRRWKIASADLGNRVLVEAIRATGKPAFYSTGVRYLLANEQVAPPEWTPLVCVSRYPARADEYYLTHIGRWGVSDHTLGSTLAVAAVARGATVIEKHIRLNDQPWSPDKDHSSSPIAFMAYVSAIRETERMLGNITRVKHKLSRKVWE